MEILDSVEIVKYVFGFSKAGLIFAITGVVIFVLAVIMSEDYLGDSAGAVLFVAAICIVISIICFMFAKPEYDYTKYYATIDDSTPVSEVLDKYEIINVHGKIYELRERENNNGND